MSFAPADPQFESRTRASFARQGAMAHLGAVLESVAPGRVEIALPFRPELSQQHGFFHAGIIATIADTAGGYAGFTLFPADAGVLTVEFKINLVAPASGERFLARGEVLRPGRTLTVCSLEVLGIQGNQRSTIAIGQQTLICLENKPDR